MFLGELFLGKAPALSQWKKLLPCLMNAVYLSLSSQKIQAQFCLNHGCCPVPLFCRALYLLKSICPFKQGFEYQKDLTNHLFLLFDMIKTSRLSAWNPSPLFRRHRSWPWETPCSEQTLNRLDVSPHSNFSRIWHNRFSESPGVFILSLFGIQRSICYGVRRTFPNGEQPGHYTAIVLSWFKISVSSRFANSNSETIFQNSPHFWVSIIQSSFVTEKALCAYIKMGNNGAGNFSANEDRKLILFLIG